MTTTTTTITVTARSWNEERVAEPAAGHAVARARFTTEWRGEFAGTSTCWLLICYVGGDPADPATLVGPYTGYEVFTGSVGGRHGSFVFSATGEHSAAVARTEVRIVPGSGTGALAGISGSGHYAATGMQYPMQLDYRLDHRRD